MLDQDVLAHSSKVSEKRKIIEQERTVVGRDQDTAIESRVQFLVFGLPRNQRSVFAGSRVLNAVSNEADHESA